MGYLTHMVIYERKPYMCHKTLFQCHSGTLHMFIFIMFRVRHVHIKLFITTLKKNNREIRKVFIGRLTSG